MNQDIFGVGGGSGTDPLPFKFSLILNGTFSDITIWFKFFQSIYIYSPFKGEIRYWLIFWILQLFRPDRLIWSSSGKI